MNRREYFVYILRCSDGSYYTGVTNDIERRLWQHRIGFMKSCYTYTRRPLALVYIESTNDIYAAISREKQIKRWSHKKKHALSCNDESTLRACARGKIGYMSAASRVIPSIVEGRHESWFD